MKDKPTLEHKWISRDIGSGITVDVCQVCTIVRRYDKKNKPCKGRPKGILREPEPILRGVGLTDEELEFCDTQDPITCLHCMRRVAELQVGKIIQHLKGE